jgi:preprotein translocase subunit SecG
MTGRSAATALAKLTWLFGAAFMACSLALTVVAARNASDASVLDRTGTGSATETPALPAGEDLLPPPATPETAPEPAPRAD